MNSAIILVLLFVAASAVRDVYFGEVFQRLEFFAVVLTAFSLTTVIFLSFVIVRGRGQFAAMRAAWREIAVTNIGTAMAWLSYFLALKLLEPAVVNMLHIGIGPLVLIALNLIGVHISGPAVVRKSELAIQAGVFLTLATLTAVVLLQLSGLGGRSTAQNILGATLALASGVFISLTTDVTKRLNNMGVGAEGVLAVRFIGIVLIAALVVVLGGGGEKPPRQFDVQFGAQFDLLWPVALASLVFMVAPLYALQLGVQRTSTVSVWIVISLSPAAVFAAEALDGRLVHSPYTLARILAYSVLALAANLARRFEGARLKAHKLDVWVHCFRSRWQLAGWMTACFPISASSGNWPNAKPRSPFGGAKASCPPAVRCRRPRGRPISTKRLQNERDHQPTINI